MTNCWYITYTKFSRVDHLTITLFRSITVLCGTDNISQNIPHVQTGCEEYTKIFYRILSVPQNIVMNLNNNMTFPKTHVTAKKLPS